jgi:hypothetical protein
MALGLFSIVAVLFGLVLLGALVAGLVIGLKSLGGFRRGHTLLTCPHCNAETPVGPKCASCGAELQ